MVVETVFDSVSETADAIGISAAFRLVEEAEAGGRAKFSRDTCGHLARVIASRAYAKRLTELSHLVVAAASTDARRRYEDFFWATGPATADVFNAYFRQCPVEPGARAPSIAVTPEVVELGYRDGDHAIAFGRMPLLSALAEFLLTALGYEAVDRLFAPLLDEGIDKRGVETAANALARDVHAYLAGQVASAQQLRKFRLMTAFLGARDGAGPAPESIDDEAVLAFWIENSGVGGADELGFKTYRSVFKSFVKLHDVLGEARDRFRLDHPRSLGADAEAGEVDPERICESLAVMHEAPDPLAALGVAPAAAIKFFNGRETRDLAPLLSRPRPRALTLSLLRSGVFGDAQSRIIATGNFDDGMGDDYSGRIARLGDLSGHCRRVVSASLHVLIRLRKVESIVLIGALDPEIDLSRLKDALFADRGIVSMSGASAAEGFVETLDLRPDSLGPDIARLVGEARIAYRSITRRGFRGGDLEAGETGDGFVAASEPLVRVGEAVRGFLDAIQRSPIDWRGQFDDDRDVFFRQFHSIHGERDVQAAE